MLTIPLTLQHGHLFVELGDARWLLDTGAPRGFGDTPALTILGERFRLDTDCAGLTASALARFVGVPCAGLLGVDVLGRFDHLFDVPGGSLTLSTTELSVDGQDVPLEEWMGIPIVPVRVRGTVHRMFFDTGAQVSYLPGDALAGFPATDSMTDFYPGIGRFRTETRTVPMVLGEVVFPLGCGTLPPQLLPVLLGASVQGIIGNAVLHHRRVGYFPRRRTLTI